MKPKTLTGRRSFLQSVALAAAGQPASAQSAAGAPPPAASPAQPARQPSVAYPRIFRGRQLQMIAFPLGGIAAGTISLGGRGQLRDWEIFNRPDKGRAPGYAFASIWVKAGDQPPVARILESRYQPPYEAARGLGPANAPGLPRLASATFRGEYPLAVIDFRDARLPVRVSLEAFTPIFPLDAEESGLPVAILRYKVSNPNNEKVSAAIAFSIENPAGSDPFRAASRPEASRRVNEFRAEGNLAGLFMHNPVLAAADPSNGSFVLGVLAGEQSKVTKLTGWPLAKWWASPLLFWDDFSSDGELGPEPSAVNPVGAVCLKQEIAPGAAADYTFLLSWNFPNRTPAGCGWSAPQGDEQTIIGNYYCKRFAGAWDSARYAARNLPALEKRMNEFLAAMRECTLPAAVKEAAMSNLSTLATQTCFRTADGRFRGFEGADDQRGCCFGNCTHVWNYESATDFLFPAMARSMREAAFELSERMDGVLPIRLQLPEGKQTSGITAADGTMGQVIKTYLDWRLSGDDAWLRRLWPAVKRAIEFSWVNGGWDADRDGVMEGVQHNTYDVEFYGPNPMCGIYYLGALAAGAEMARAVGDSVSAATYDRLRQKGSAWIDANLFNGEYYVQKITPIPPARIAPPLQSKLGAEDPENPDFQMGEGCLVDQLVGQYVAEYAGLGPLVDPARIRKTLESIYTYNYKRALHDHNSVQRIFALNDEAALIICDYGKARRPRVPFPYFAEIMTGFEYSAAVLMLAYGMVPQGLECIENIRRRYDGERRNPWDEAECGHHYARAMAAWSAIVVLSGFRYDASRKRLAVAPVHRPSNAACFWSVAGAWGVFRHRFQKGAFELSLAVREGTLPLQTVELARTIAPGRVTSAVLGARKLPHTLQRVEDRTVLQFDPPAEVSAGENLVLTA